MQGYYAPALENLIGLLTRLPGIGQKSATRITLFLMRDKTSLALDTARALSEIKEKIRFCSVCFNFTETDPCPICSSPARADGTVCVVEGPGDQLALVLEIISRTGTRARFDGAGDGIDIEPATG